MPNSKKVTFSEELFFSKKDGYPHEPENFYNTSFPLVYDEIFRENPLECIKLLGREKAKKEKPTGDDRLAHEREVAKLVELGYEIIETLRNGKFANTQIFHLQAGLSFFEDFREVFADFQQLKECLETYACSTDMGSRLLETNALTAAKHYADNFVPNPIAVQIQNKNNGKGR